MGITVTNTNHDLHDMICFFIMFIAANIIFMAVSPRRFRDERMVEPECLPYSLPSSKGTDTWDGITVADAGVDPSKISLLYSGCEIYPGHRDKEYADGRWTREHVWPRSRAPGMSTDRPGMGTDMHNLFAADQSVNSARRNKHFARLPAGEPVVDSSPVGGSDGRLDAKTSPDAWEPPDDCKGIVARAAMYMACMYCDSLRLSEGTDSREPGELGNLSDLLDWNARFPPSAREIARNDAVEKLQGNRNPFVDDPGLAAAVRWDRAAVSGTL